MKFKTNKKYVIFLIFIVLIAPFFLFTLKGFAVSAGCSSGGPCLSPPGISEGKTSDFTELLRWLLRFMFYASGILAVLMLVIGGVQYVLAGSTGNPEKIGDAQSRLLAALGGLVLALGAWIILNTINPNLLKIDLDLRPVPSDQSN